MTKAEYEAKLGPLLNDVVDPALKAALSNGGIRNPQKVTAAIASVKVAHDEMARVKPPAAVADLHGRTVTVLSSMIADMTRLRDAETKHDTSGESSAAKGLKNDAEKLVKLGDAFTSRGY